MTATHAPAAFHAPELPYIAEPSERQYAESTFDSPGIRADAINLYETVSADAPAKYRPLAQRALLALAHALNEPLGAFSEAMVVKNRHNARPTYHRDTMRSTLTDTFGAALTEAEAAATKAAQHAEELRTTVNRDAAATMPAGMVEATVEARKADVRLRLDNVPYSDPHALIERLLAILSDAISDSDDTTAWLTGAHDWPVWYLESRGIDPRNLDDFKRRRAEMYPMAEDRAAAIAFRDGLLPQIERLAYSMGEILRRSRQSRYDLFEGQVLNRVQ